MKKYEAVFILDDRKSEDGGAQFMSDLESQIAKLGGKVLARNSMGRRQLAAYIRKRHTGVYWDLTLELPEDKVRALREHYRLHEAVLRMRMFIYDRPDRVQLPPRVRPAGETAAPAPVPAEIAEKL